MNPVDNPVKTQPGRRGGTLRRGGTNPNAGRPPEEFRRRMRQLANLEEADAYLRECLSGKHGPKAFGFAQQYVTDRGYGKAVQPIVGEEGLPPINVAVRYVKAVNGKPADGA